MALMQRSLLKLICLLSNSEGQWKRKIFEWNISKRLENPGKERLEFDLEALGLSKGEDAYDPKTNSQGLGHTWSDDKVTSTASQDSVYQHHRRQLASQMKESPRREQKRSKLTRQSVISNY